jgi:hypothetical protein
MGSPAAFDYFTDNVAVAERTVPAAAALKVIV